MRNSKMKNWIAIQGLLALILLAPSARAGVGVGEKAPPVQTKLIENTSLRSLDSLRGKVVLYAFLAF